MFQDAYTGWSEKITKRPLNRFGLKEIAMHARRFERIALELMLSGCAVMFGFCAVTPGNGRGTGIGFERRPVPGEARRIAVAKLPELLSRR